MLDAGFSTRMQRSCGEAAVVMRQGVAKARLVDLRQAGSAKAMLPRCDGSAAEVVFLNTSGGLTGGDRLTYRLDLSAGCRVLATTQTAERCYATAGGAAEVGVQMTVGAGARLDWLPQETILFDSASLQRKTEIDLAVGAECLLSESITLGRQAMGETLHLVDLCDHRLIRRQSRPVWADSLRLTAAVLAEPQSAALLAGARALAVVVLVAQGAEDAATALRHLATGDGCTGAVSGWDGKCVVRLMAVDGWPLRQHLARILEKLRGGALPRVWQAGGMT
jgi:urease accessory protein